MEKEKKGLEEEGRRRREKVDKLKGKLKDIEGEHL